MLDTGLGAPKHPLFLLGKKHSDAGNKPSHTTAARSLRSWWVGRKAVRQPVTAAMQPKRNSVIMPSPQQGLSMVPHLALPFPGSSSLSASSLHHSTPAEQPSLQLAVSNGRSPAGASANPEASMQRDAGIPDPSWVSRPHPTPMPRSMLALPAADSDAHTAADSLPNLPGSAVDVEAQNGTCLVSHAPNSTAEITAAGCDLWPRDDGSENGDAMDEPADVAAERVKADRLWDARKVPRGDDTSRSGEIESRSGEIACRSGEIASRGGHSGGSASPAGPAILLHNLRKVCNAAHS